MKDSKREMMIIFVYDSGYCQKEADDPLNSILYFYPKWVSDYQKLLLCGQLMGTVQILKNTFDNSAKIVSLNNGKFFVHKFDRFVLVIGSDRNIPETMLNYRTELISSFLNTFHNGIEAIVRLARGSNAELSEILYNIFEEYLPIVQRNCNVFKSTPRLKLPKSASNAYLEANQLLQSILLVNGVLGGVIFYKNKVLTSQLPSSLTKLLLLANMRSKWFCEMIKNISYHIPFGCNLKNLYVSKTDHKNLHEYVSEIRSIFKNLNLKETLLPFQIKKKNFTRESSSMIRREKSLAFENIPEEEGEDALSMDKTNGTVKRPTNLSLKLKSNASKDILKEKKNNIKFDEFDSFPNFIGKTSVILTPMAENKIFSHKDLISIGAKTETIPEEPTKVKSDKSIGIGNKISSSISMTNLNEKVVGNKLYRTLSDPTLAVSDENNSTITSKLYNEFLYSDNIPTKNNGKNNNTFVKNIDVNSNVEKRKVFDKKSLTLTLNKNTFDKDSQMKVLTPLMSKLSDFSVKEKKIVVKEQNNWPPKLLKKDRPEDEYSDVNSNNERVKCELFVCEQGNMSLLIVLDAGSNEKQQIIQDLFDTCISRISKIETHLMQALTIQVEASDKSNDKNGLICLDKEWDIVEECGTWTALPNSLELVHSVFTMNRLPGASNFESLTDIILKTNDHVLYGNCTGENEVYYNQAHQTSQIGLPPPQDILAKIAFNAKRKLERDHSQILF